MADLPPSRDPRTRYHFGMDRWKPEALNGREVVCSMSHSMTHAMDRRGGIWWWYADEQLWYRMDPVREPLIRAEDRALLGAMIDAGHAASHRGHRPPREHLETILDTVENLLHRKFVLPSAAAEIKLATPTRAQRR